MYTLDIPARGETLQVPDAYTLALILDGQGLDPTYATWAAGIPVGAVVLIPSMGDIDHMSLTRED